MNSNFSAGMTAVLFTVACCFLVFKWIRDGARTGRSVFRVVNPKSDSQKKTEAKEHLEEIREWSGVYKMLKNTSIAFVILFVLSQLLSAILSK